MNWGGGSGELFSAPSDATRQGGRRASQAWGAQPAGFTAEGCAAQGFAAHGLAAQF